MNMACALGPVNPNVIVPAPPALRRLAPSLPLPRRPLLPPCASPLRPPAAPLLPFTASPPLPLRPPGPDGIGILTYCNASRRPGIIIAKGVIAHTPGGHTTPMERTFDMRICHDSTLRLFFGPLSLRPLFGAAAMFLCFTVSAGAQTAPEQATSPSASRLPDGPIITHIYTADPSAHVFEGKIYLYPSHDRETDIPDDDLGSQYDMNDYHVFSMEQVGGPVTDHGVALALEDIPWASQQLWAPDAATTAGQYLLYFPARDKEGIFRIGVAAGDRPEGPFKADPEPIAGSFSMDPCAFVDDDKQAYMFFGGLWGGQLEKWATGEYDPDGKEPSGDAPALGPRVAQLSGDLRGFDGPVREVQILDEDGQPLRADDHDRRFFEGAWMHKLGDAYYLSYSTGNTHYLVYAIGDNPLGPFTYAGRILEPVLGWTTHHSIVQYKGVWYLFHHDASLSGGKNHLRCVKVKAITHDDQGRIHLVRSEN